MKLTRTQTIFFCFALLVSPLSLVAQSEPEPNMPSSPSSNPNGQNTPGAQKPNSGALGQDSSNNAIAGADAQGMRDKIFLRKAAEGAVLEVQLAQLALQRSGSDDVKKFAQKMIDDHSAMDSSMKPIADELGVRLPKEMSKADQGEYDKLSGLSGSAFDKEYLAFTSKAHHENLRDFRQEANTAQDPALREAVAKGTRTIAMHTRLVDRLATAEGVPVAGRAKS